MRIRLQRIEKRILEIMKLVSKDSRERGLSGRGIARSFIDDEIKAQDEPLLKEKEQLEKELEFILARRNGWLPTTIWNVIVPVIVSIITAYALNAFDLRSN